MIRYVPSARVDVRRGAMSVAPDTAIATSGTTAPVGVPDGPDDRACCRIDNLAGPRRRRGERGDEEKKLMPVSHALPDHEAGGDSIVVASLPAVP